VEVTILSPDFTRAINVPVIAAMPEAKQAVASPPSRAARRSPRMAEFGWVGLV